MMSLISAFKNRVENLPEGVGRWLANVPFALRLGPEYTRSLWAIRRAERTETALFEAGYLAQLRTLLRAAVDQVEFYRTFYQSKGFSPNEVQSLADWARVMGFDWRKIPMIREAFNESAFPIAKGQPTDIEVCSEVRDWNGRLSEIEDRDFFSFKPHFGWAGHIEYDRGN